MFLTYSFLDIQLLDFLASIKLCFYCLKNKISKGKTATDLNTLYCYSINIVIVIKPLENTNHQLFL